MDWLYLRNTVTFQMLFLVFILHVSINAQGQVQPCPVFKVLRGIVHKVCLNKPLKISCSLKNCDGQKINITWTKADDLDKWIPVNKTNQISSSQKDFDSHNLTSYLSFTNVLNHHEGLYRCELKLSNMSTVSHHINVSVSDGSNGTEISCTEIIKVQDNDSDLWWLPYLFICMGVVFLVLMTMIISILCITGFKCLRKKVHQISQVQNSEETLHHNVGLSTFPPDQSTPYESNDAHDSLSNTENNRSSQVIYASLHHFIPTQSSTTSFRKGEEFTEYAPIRVS